jgi:cyclic beta-1,2-glucan synthetase
MWAVLAFARMGAGDDAAALFALLNPITHADTSEATERYKVEPYVVAADVYSVAPHVGRGGWTWYTGSAGWMHRAGVEGILGIRREGEFLVLDPCIPTSWPGFEAAIALGSSRYTIRVTSIARRSRQVSNALLDGVPIDCSDGTARVRLESGNHDLTLTM